MSRYARFGVMSERVVHLIRVLETSLLVPPALWLVRHRLSFMLRDGLLYRNTCPRVRPTKLMFMHFWVERNLCGFGAWVV
jgi:hypothetical protein